MILSLQNRHTQRIELIREGIEHEQLTHDPWGVRLISLPLFSQMISSSKGLPGQETVEFLSTHKT